MQVMMDISELQHLQGRWASNFLWKFIITLIVVLLLVLGGLFLLSSGTADYQIAPSNIGIAVLPAQTDTKFAYDQTITPESNSKTLATSEVAQQAVKNFSLDLSLFILVLALFGIVMLLTGLVTIAIHNSSNSKEAKVGFKSDVMR